MWIIWIQMWIFFWITFNLFGCFDLFSNTWMLGSFVFCFLLKYFDYFNEWFHICPDCERIIAKYSRPLHRKVKRIMECFAIAVRVGIPILLLLPLLLCMYIIGREGVALLFMIFLMYLSYCVEIMFLIVINSIPALFLCVILYNLWKSITSDTSNNLLESMQ